MQIDFQLKVSSHFRCLIVLSRSACRAKRLKELSSLVSQLSTLNSQLSTLNSNLSSLLYFFFNLAYSFFAFSNCLRKASLPAKAPSTEAARMADASMSLL